jgi:hypothetical protein
MQLCEDDPRLGYKLMYNMAADLAYKIRNSGFIIREKLLYSSMDTGPISDDDPSK